MDIRLAMCRMLPLLIVPLLSAVTIHVPSQQPTIQAGLDAAQAYDTVFVADGIYYENIHWPDNLNHGIKLVGQSEGGCIIDGNRAGSVLTIDGTVTRFDTTTVISHLTLRNGLNRISVTQSFGSGAFISFASPLFEHVTFADNLADRKWSVGAGAFSFAYSCPAFRHVTFIGNRCIAYCEGSSGCWAQGGGMAYGMSMIPGCTILLEDVVFLDNTVEAGCLQFGACYSMGGGLALLSMADENIRLVDVVAMGNSATVDCNNQDNCESAGGGIYADGGGQLVILRGLMADNHAETACQGQESCGGFGGGLLSRAPTRADQLTVVNNTVEGTHIGGGGLFVDTPRLELEHSIVWNNQGPGITLWPLAEPDSVSIACSDLLGGAAGIDTHSGGSITWHPDNLDTDPQFCDPATGDYHLMQDSPARLAACGTMGYSADSCAVVSLAPGLILPSTVRLTSGYPNPFNSGTTLLYTLPSRQHVHLAVYDISGRLLNVLVNGMQEPGEHRVHFEAGELASGFCVCELRTPAGSDRMKLLHLK